MDDTRRRKSWRKCRHWIDADTSLHVFDEEATEFSLFDLYTKSVDDDENATFVIESQSTKGNENEEMLDFSIFKDAECDQSFSKKFSEIPGLVSTSTPRCKNVFEATADSELLWTSKLETPQQSPIFGNLTFVLDTSYNDTISSQTFGKQDSLLPNESRSSEAATVVVDEGISPLLLSQPSETESAVNHFLQTPRINARRRHLIKRRKFDVSSLNSNDLAVETNSQTENSSLVSLFARGNVIAFQSNSTTLMTFHFSHAGAIFEHAEKTVLVDVRKLKLPMCDIVKLAKSCCFNNNSVRVQMFVQPSSISALFLKCARFPALSCVNVEVNDTSRISLKELCISTVKPAVKRASSTFFLVPCVKRRKKENIVKVSCKRFLYPSSCQILECQKIPSFNEVSASRVSGNATFVVPNGTRETLVSNAGNHSKTTRNENNRFISFGSYGVTNSNKNYAKPVLKKIDDADSLDRTVKNVPFKIENVPCNVIKMEKVDKNLAFETEDVAKTGLGTKPNMPTSTLQHELIDVDDEIANAMTIFNNESDYDGACDELEHDEDLIVNHDDECWGDKMKQSESSSQTAIGHVEQLKVTEHEQSMLEELGETVDMVNSFAVQNDEFENENNDAEELREQSIDFLSEEIPEEFWKMDCGAPECDTFESTANNFTANVSNKVESEVLSQDCINSFLNDCHNDLLLENCSNSADDENAVESMDSISTARNVDYKSFGGFKTAGGREIVIDENALEEAKSFFKDECPESLDSSRCVNDDFEDNKMAEMSNSSAGKDTIKSRTSCLPRFDMNTNDPSKVPSFCGFQTAGGKTVVVSDRALEEARNKYKELSQTNTSIENTIQLSVEQSSGTCWNQKKRSDGEMMHSLDPESSDAFKPDYVQPKSPSGKSASATKSNVNMIKANQFCGFQTAAGKTVVVSDRALEEARNKCKELFQTNANAENRIKRTLELSENCLDETDQPCVEVLASKISFLPDCVQQKSSSGTKCSSEKKSDVNTTKAKQFCGFQTAGGKAVIVSDRALEEARNKCKELFQTDVTAENLVKLSSERSEKSLDRVKVSKSKIPFLPDCVQQKLSSANESSFKTKADANTSKLNQNMRFCGFQTAGGKTVVISDEALNAAKNKYREELSESVSCNEATAMPKISSIVSAPISSSDRSESIQLPDRSSSPTFSTFSNASVSNVAENKPLAGFQTAGGSKISISEKAIEKARTILHDDNLLDNDWFLHDFDGKTGVSKQVEVKSREKYEALSCMNASTTTKIEDLGLHKGNIPHESTPVTSEQKPFGFQTAGGKSVNISDSALQKVRTIFEDEFSVTDSNMGAVLADAPVLNKSSSLNVSLNKRKLDNDLIGSGFKTAGGKKVSVSESAYESARKLLRDDLLPDSNTFTPKSEPTKMSTGFCTGKGKSVSVASATFNEAKKLFCESGDGMQVTNVGSKTELSAHNGKIGLHDQNLSAKKFTSCKRKLLDDDNESFEVHGSTTKEISMASRKYVSMRLSEQALKQVMFDENGNVATADSSFGKSNISFADSLSSLEQKQDASFVSGVMNAAETCSLNTTRISTQDTLSESLLAEVNDSTAIFLADEERNGSILSTSMDASTLVVDESDLTLTIKRQLRVAAREKLQNVMKTKSSSIVKASSGLLFQRKNANARIPMTEFAGKPKGYSVDKLRSMGLKSCILKVNAITAQDFRFGKEFFCSSLDDVEIASSEDTFFVLDDRNSLGREEVFSSFCALPNVDPKLISEKWVYNHYRWIVWKLASMERSFPEEFANRCLTPDQVLLQLKYRYDREIDRSQRSALKRITERDDSPNKTLVLCVASMKASDPKSALKGELTLELTDGWYSIPTVVDSALKAYMKRNKIFVGQKLITHGAELVGTNEAFSPLEIPPNLMLKIDANSTRPARWYAKLGFNRVAFPFPVSLSSIHPLGGMISHINVVVLRVYPLQFMEKTENCTIVRNVRGEDKAAAQHERLAQTHLERIHNVLSARLEKLGLAKGMIADIYSQSELPPSCQQYKLHEESKLKYETEFKKIVNEEKENGRFPKDRVVIRFAEVLIAGTSPDDILQTNSCILTIWRPTDDFHDVFKEGQALQIFYVTPTNVKGKSLLHLSTTRSTKYIPKKKMDSVVVSSVYSPRQLTALNEVDQLEQHTCITVDVVGVVVSIMCKPKYDLVFITDADLYFVGIQFWNGLTGHCLNDLIKPKTCIAACNVQRKSSNFQTVVPVLDASLNSVFSSNPKQSHLQNAFGSLMNIIKSHENFVEDALLKFKSVLNEQQRSPVFNSYHGRVSQSTSNETPAIPHRSTNSNFRSGPLHNIASNVGALESRERSIASVVGTSPSTINRLQKLQTLGYPPPISPINIPVSKNVRNEFKSPFRK